MSNIDLYSEVDLINCPHDWYVNRVLQALGLIACPYNREELYKYLRSNAFHKRAISWKSGRIKAFSFEDDTKAGKIPDFLKNNLADIHDHHMTSLEFFDYGQSNHAMYNEIMVHLKQAAGGIITMYPLKTKNIFPTEDKKKFVKVTRSKDLLDIFHSNADVETQNEKANAAGFSEFINYSDAKTSDTDLCAQFIKLGYDSDYYADLPYEAALKGVKTQLNIGNFDDTFIDNTQQFSGIFEIIDNMAGEDIDGKTAVSEFKKQLAEAKRSNNGKYLVTARPPKAEGNINYIATPFSGKQDFTETFEQTRETILTAHDTSTTLLGIQTGGGGLSTTEQKGAYSIDNEEQTVPLLEKEASFYDRIFKFIDPNYNTKLIFHSSDFSKEANLDLKIKEEDLELKRDLREDRFVKLGDLEGLNAFRENVGREKLSNEQLQGLKLDTDDTGL